MITIKDCDAKFGTLWKATLKRPILSPQEYRQLVRTCLGKNRNIQVEVIDIFVCPDYINLMWDCIDHDIKSIWKKEQAQLQWCFEAVPRDINHRVGVHSTYRGYDQDNVFQIIEIDPLITPQYSLDFRVQYTEVPTQPTADDEFEFIGFLQKLPTREVKPVGIYKNSTRDVTRILQEINSYFTKRNNTVVLKQWSEFGETLPKSDNIREYMDDIKTNSYLPLKDELFGANITHDLTSVIQPTVSAIRKTDFGNINFETFDNEPIPKARMTASASHYGYNKSQVPPIVVFSDPAAASSPEEAYEMLLNKIFNFTEDNCPTIEGLKVFLDKADIGYKKSWRKRQLLEA